MRMLTLVLVLAAAPLSYAQRPAPKMDPANPISSGLNGSYERVKKFLIGAADEMPAADYSFKPTPDVRSFGQLVGHVANASYMFCSAAKGEAAPKHDDAEKLTSKAEVQKALAAAFAYCDKVYADGKDAQLGSTMVQLFGNKMPKFMALDINNNHYNEHYGNLVTYLRLKKLTPPSSQGGM